jgi:NADH dehydrogenase
MDNILLLGATGFVGLPVVEKLVERTGGGDARIVVATRHVKRAMHLQCLPTVEISEWNPDDDTDLDRLVRGRDAVINLVGILHGSEADFQRVHAKLPERLAHACGSHGVRRIVHLSALGADAQGPSMYLRSKGAGEAALRGVAGVEPVILRPSVIFGDGDRFMNRFARLQRVLPLMPLPCADARFQPVWVDDVATAVAHALDRRHPEIVECAGPNVYTLRRLVELAGVWSGHPRRVVPLPDALGRLQAALMEFMPGDPPMSRDNLDSMRIASVPSGRYPTLPHVGVTPRALESVMPAVLAERAGIARLNALRTLAHRG